MISRRCNIINYPRTEVLDQIEYDYHHFEDYWSFNDHEIMDQLKCGNNKLVLIPPTIFSLSHVMITLQCN